MIRLTLALALSLAFLGCAGKPPAPSVWIDAYQSSLSEAESFFPDAVARDYLKVARTRFSLAEELHANKKYEEAVIAQHLAAVTARVGLEAAKAEWELRRAEECDIQVEKARQEWLDALHELERTEGIAGRTMEVTREAQPVGLKTLGFITHDRPYLRLEDVPTVLAEARDARRLAESLGVVISDLTGPMEHFTRKAEGIPEDRAPYDLLAARSAQSIQYRVKAARAGERCRQSVQAIAHYNELEKEAVWALVQLERTMKESARVQLEEERALMESQQNKLYNALKQFEGKFAQLTQEARGTILSMGDILFETGQADLKQQAMFNLVKVATILQQFPDMHIYVEGHTDDVGAEDYNKKLSEERAQAVFNFLHQQGVPLEYMDWYGFGMEKPVAPNTSAENRAKNRRVDIVIGAEND